MDLYENPNLKIFDLRKKLPPDQVTISSGKLKAQKQSIREAASIQLRQTPALASGEPKIDVKPRYARARTCVLFVGLKHLSMACSDGWARDGSSSKTFPYSFVDGCVQESHQSVRSEALVVIHSWNELLFMYLDSQDTSL